MTKNIFILIFIFLFKPSSTFGQVEIQYIALHSSDVTNDLTDLKLLKKYFGGVKLVDMGESTHGTHEFFTMRHRMFKYLVLEHSYNTFFLEADYANCLPIDKYIKGADGNLNQLVNYIDVWPWQTNEIGELIEWMKGYNQIHPESMLSFIGCDMQRIKTTIDEIDNIISKHNPTLVDTVGYEKISNLSFMKSTDTDHLSYYDSLLKRKDILISKLPLTTHDKFIYQTLKRHYIQIIEDKSINDINYRDKSMAENITYHMNNNELIKGFFWAHNQHIYNILKEKKKAKKSYYTAGGLLKKNLGKEYFIIGQEFDEGSFNAYSIIDLNEDRDDINNYKFGEVTIEPSIAKTFGEYFRNVKNPILFIPASALLTTKQKYLKAHHIGATFIPSAKNIHQDSHFASCNGCFDAMILIKTSTPTKLLKSTANKTNNE